MKKICISVVCAVVAGIAFAGDPSFLITDLKPNDPVVLGEWNLGMEKCITYARDNDLPLFAIWSQMGCGVCSRVTAAIRSNTFVNWRKTSPKAQIVFCFMGDQEAGHPDQIESNAFHWMRIGSMKNGQLWGPAADSGFRWSGKLVNFPYSTFYWASKKVNDHKEASASFMQAGNTADLNAKNIINYLETMLKDYTGPKLGYAGGEFLVGNGPNERMEIEKGVTQALIVPMTRTNSLDRVTTNKLVATWGSSKKTVDVVWPQASPDLGYQEAYPEVPIPAGMATGDRLTLVLQDQEGNDHATNFATCVVTANSSANPLWVGERTLQNLQFGEWTMDLNLATQKVAATAGDAYTLVLMTGALWCPHCKGLDRQVFASSAFKTFLAGNKLALVSLDNPRRPKDGGWMPTGDPPTLLRYASGVANTNTGRRGSGAGYMTRHHVDVKKAESVLMENHRLGYTAIKDGGLAPFGRAYAGYPTVMILDKKGRLVGNIPLPEIEYPWIENPSAGPDDPSGDSVGRMDVAATIRRIQDLIQLSKLGKTVYEDNPSTSQLVIPVGPVGTWTAVTNYINASGLADAWRLVGDEDCVEVALRAVGSPLTGHAALTVAVGAQSETVSGALAGGFRQTVRNEDNVPAWVTVRGDANDADKVFDKFGTGDSLRKYELAARAVIVPSAVVTNEYDGLDALLQELALYIEENRLYMLKGVDVKKMTTTEMTNAFEVVNPELNIYSSRMSDVIDVPLAAAEQGAKAKSFSCYIAESVEIGFLRGQDFFPEPEIRGEKKDVSIWLSRLNTISGEARTYVEFLGGDANTNRYAFGSEWTVDFNRYGTSNLVTEVTWGGDDQLKALSFQVIGEMLAYGDQQLCFGLHTIGSRMVRIPQGRETFTAILTDNDVDGVGKLAITDANPAFSRNMQIVAVRGQMLRFTVSRLEGFSGNVSAHLELTQDGKIQGSTDPQIWISQETETREFEIKLNRESTATEAYVTLVPAGNVDVVASRMEVTVRIVSDGLPRCKTDDSAWLDLPQYVRYECAHEFDNLQGGDLSVRLVSGSLPSGISGTVEGDVFRVSGVPTAAGRFIATYQIYEQRDEGLVKGGTFAVRLNVCSLSSSSGSHTSGIPTFDRALDFPNCIFQDTEQSPGGNGYVWGTLNLSLPVNGRASAKLVCALGTFAYSATSWNGWSADFGHDLLFATLRCEKPFPVESGTPGTLEVTLEPQTRRAVLSLNCGDGEAREIVVVAPEWTADSAHPWAGTYAVQLSQETNSFVWSGAIKSLVATNLYPASGSASLSLRMSESASGRMTFAGTLPNGRAVSGSSILLRPDTNTYTYTTAALPEGFSDDAILPFFCHTDGLSGHSFAGAVRINPDGGEKLVPDPQTGELSPQCVYSMAELRPYWLRKDTEDRFSWFEAFGAYSNGRITDLCGLAGLSNLVFGVTTCSIASSYGGFDGKSWPRFGIGVSNETVTADSPALKFSYNATSGILSGSFELPLETADVPVSFRGILLPGWPSQTRNQGEDCGGGSGCGYGVTPRHLMSGSCWFIDELGMKQFVDGCEVWIDMEVK